MPTQLFTAPTEEPLSLAEAKLHVKQDLDVDDELLTSQIVAARMHCEKLLGQQLCTATLRLYLDRFPRRTIELAMPPLVEVSSIKYFDTAGELITLNEAAYDVDAISKPGRIEPSYGNFWPLTRRKLNAVCVEYVAGYGDADDVPEDIKHAMKLIIGLWYFNREAYGAKTLDDRTAGSVNALLDGHWHGAYALEGHGCP